MSEQNTVTPQPNKADAFRQQAEQGSSGLIASFWGYFRDRKRWWLLPVVLFLLVAAFLVLFASSPAAPLIYTLF